MPVENATQSAVTDDHWLLRLAILIQAAAGPISAETVLAYAERHKLRGTTLTQVRKSLSSLARKGLLRPVGTPADGFVTTRRGNDAADEARARLSNLLRLDNHTSS